MSLLPEYTHIVSNKLKHVYLSFDEHGTLIIKSPKVSQSFIEKLLLKKASWITRSRTKIAQKKGKKIDFSEKSELYFLGESHPISIVQQAQKRTKLLFDGDTFTLYYHNYNLDTFQKHIDNFYKEEAKQYIPSLVHQAAEMMDLEPNHISFRKTKRQWGSCSSKNNLSFNTMIMKLPLDVIQYIIVHELAHIRYKHHQKAFWQYVETYIPNYKESVKRLKSFST